MTSAQVQAASAAVSAVATMVLVGITAAYARESKRMADEMERGRKATTSPRLALTMRRPRTGDSGSPLPYLLNLGPGDAVDVQAALAYEPNLHTWSKNWHLLRPGEGIVVTPFGSEYASKNVGNFPASATLRMVATCANPHGRERLSFIASLPVAETVNLAIATAAEVEGPRT